MIIVQIRFDEQKNGFIYTLDDGRELLVSYDAYLSLGLHAPANPTDEQEERILAEDARFRAFSIGVRYASYQPRTASEVKRRLSRENISLALQEQVVEKLTKNGWLDDVAYARRYAEEKQRKGWSLRHISSSLREKGIEYALLQDVLQEIPLESEKEVLRTLLRKKYARRDLSDKKEFQRTMQALCRRGFSFDDVLSVLREGEKR